MNKELAKRYCKKCGCELSSTNRYKRCNACRRRAAETSKKILGVGVGVAVSGLFAFFKHGRGNKA